MTRARGGDGADGAQTLGAFLRALRDQAGLSQEELAHLAGLSVDAVSALERGSRTRPHPSTVRALTTALRLDDESSARLRFLARGEPARRTSGGQLPTWPTEDLVGRAADVSELKSLVHTARLVTITGPGGVGKSRLAVALGRAEAQRRNVRVLWIPLAAVTEPALVLPRFVDAVGATAGQSSVTGICRRLETTPTLVLVDNFEQVLDAASFLADLLAGTSTLRILVTSRTVLGLRGEREYLLAPLALPRRAATLAELNASPAAQLLAARRAVVRQGYLPNAEDVLPLAVICRATGGLPLALELAASALRVLDPQSLVSRLDDLLGREGARDLPARQSSLRATIDWSYQLLDGPDQTTLRALSVFAGGFGVEDAAAVVGSHAPSSLERLVAASLCGVTPGPGGGLRFTMLPPILAFARERLGAEEAQGLRRRHSAHYASIADTMLTQLQGGEQLSALATFDLEEDNLWTAATTAVDADDGATATRLVWALWTFWWIRGRRTQGWALVRQLRTRRLGTVDRARVLHAWSALADRTVVDWQELQAVHIEAHSLAREADDPQVLMCTSLGFGLLALDREDLPSAVSWFEAALEPAARAGRFGTWMTRQALVFLATALNRQDDALGARECATTAIQQAELDGDPLVLTIALHSLAVAELRLGDPAEAQNHLRRAISLARETGDADNLANLLLTLALSEVDDGDIERTVALLGASDAMRAQAGPPVITVHPSSTSLRDELRSRTQTRVSARTWKHAFDTGRGLDLDDACRLALAPGIEVDQ
jgi:predicted ATPase/DNA-binding XRE family transcriptional regulator